MEGGYLMLIDMSGYVGEHIYVREMTSSLGQTGVIIIGDSATLLDPFFFSERPHLGSGQGG